MFLKEIHSEGGKYMRKKYDAVLLDADGTLFDSKDFIHRSFLAALGRHQTSHVLSWEELTEICRGMALEEAYRAITGETNVEHFCKTHRAYQHEHEHTLQLFHGVEKTLTLLWTYGLKLAVVTNRADSVHTTLRRTRLIDFFETVRNLDNTEGRKKKPHPDMVIDALRILKVDASRAIMVGDTMEDIKAGKAAGVKTVGAAYGFTGKRIADYNPDHVIHDIGGLLEILKE